MKLKLLKNTSLLVTLVAIINFIGIVNATILAIDYGKGFSKSSIIGVANPLDIVLSQDSKRKDVSGIMLKPENNNLDIERSYGSNLLNFQLRFPQYVVLGLKTLIGKSSVSEIFKDFNSGLKIEPSSDVLQVDVGTKHRFSVEEMIAMDFNHIIHNANQQFPKKKKVVLNGVNNEINDLVLSVPNYYKQQELLMLDDVCAISDFKRTLGFVDDNLATGISFIAKSHFKFEDDLENNFIVYDMGQGSLKVSLFTAFKNSSAELKQDEVVDLTIELNGYSYDDSLGGDNFSNDLKTLILHKFLDKNTKYSKKELLGNAKFLNKIIQAAEKCKLVLSANSDYKVFIESLIDDLDFKTTVTRKEFEDIIMKNYQDQILKPLLEVFESSNSVFQKQNMSLENISSIILTGGSTRVPFVQQVLSDYLGTKYIDLLSKSVNSDESVTTGLAIRGVKLENSFKFKQNINVVDKLIYNYSMSIAGDEEVSVFDASDSYPCKKTLTFPLDILGNKKALNIQLSEDNTSFVEYKVNPVSKKCSAEDAAMNITFTVNKNRIFSIENAHSVCNGTATKLNTLIVDKYLIRQPLSKSEITKSKKYIKQLNEKDEQKVLLTEALNLFESSIYATKSFLEEIENENVPEEYIEKLLASIEEHLEWMYYESDGCTLQDVESRHLDISHQVKNIKNYQLSLTTSLDVDEFNQIFQNITTWLSDLEALELLHLEAVLNKTEKFEELNITGSPVDVYRGTPLTKRLTLQNESFTIEFNELNSSFVPRLISLLDNFEKEDRLDKFELKLEFLNHLASIKELDMFVDELFKYRFRYLEAMIAKKDRQLLRQYEKARLEKVKELGLKDKDGNLVEEIMEKAHNRAEEREKQDEEDFMKNTEGYEQNSEEEMVSEPAGDDDIEIEFDEL